MPLSRCFAFFVLLAGCAPVASSGGNKVSSTDDALTGCEGQASSTIPANDTYYLTSFGGPGESGKMACGESTKDGTWYYMASRQRFGCGAHVELRANGKCVVAEADDYGPDVCVEHAAGKAIIDASPLVAEHLFGDSSAGWSDHLEITATVVSDSTPLGICQSASTVTCYSTTVGKTLSGGACVQSSADGNWYQCTSGGWAALTSNDGGPYGTCTSSYPLSQ